jgi:sugar/nucleoside kinase (ribokinase family)
LKRVVVIGDVIEDIIVIADSRRSEDTDNRSEIHATPGGSGANFAVWLASLGHEVELISRVAERDRAKLTAYFESKFVISKLEPDPIHETGRIVVLVEGNSRTFFTDRAANQYLTAERADLNRTDVLYLSGYSVVTLGIERTQQLIDKASAAGVLVAVDPGSSSFISEFGTEEFLKAISGSDFLFPNEAEYQLLSSSVDLTQMFSEVVVTRGSAGSEVLGYGRKEAVVVDVVDPTGAGDAFAAKYLASRLDGAEVLDALTEANSFAAQAVTKAGGQP